HNTTFPRRTMIVPVVILSLLAAFEVTSLPIGGFSSPNGLICDTCSSPGSTSCRKSDITECVGEMTMCFVLTFYKAGVKDSVWRGCTRKYDCDRGNYTATYDNVVHKQVMICTEAKRP
ncbi:hypothetical protein GDO81_027713, partial [Engystomops pustulosus]